MRYVRARVRHVNNTYKTRTTEVVLQKGGRGGDGVSGAADVDPRNPDTRRMSVTRVLRDKSVT
jgi:hypothetical protein